MDNFSRSGSGGVNLSRLSVGMDLDEPASSKWSSTTSIKFEVWANLLHYSLVSSYQYHCCVFSFFSKFLYKFVQIITEFKPLSSLMQHVRPMNDDGHFISRDADGFPVTCR